MMVYIIFTSMIFLERKHSNNQSKSGCAQDHPACLSAMLMSEEAGIPCVTDELLRRNGSVRLRAILKYTLFRKGPLATTGCDHGAFVSTTGARPLRHLPSTLTATSSFVSTAVPL